MNDAKLRILAEEAALRLDRDRCLGAINQLADALIEIVSQPWRRLDGEDGVDAMVCPSCMYGIALGSHAPGCAWLIAARALGVAK